MMNWALWVAVTSSSIKLNTFFEIKNENRANDVQINRIRYIKILEYVRMCKKMIKADSMNLNLG